MVDVSNCVGGWKDSCVGVVGLPDLNSFNWEMSLRKCSELLWMARSVLSPSLSGEKFVSKREERRCVQFSVFMFFSCSKR